MAHATKRLLAWFVLLLAVAWCSASTPAQEARPPRDPSTPTIDEVLLFQPLKFPTGNWQPRDLACQDVEFASADGTKLHGWFCAHDNPLATVLYLHGNAGNITHRADLLRYLHDQHRLQILIFDYRGYGRSAGVPTVPKVIEDATAARAQLAALAGIQETEVVLMGRSLGGALAIQLAASDSCRGLIVESSFDSLQTIARHHFPKLAWLVPADKLNSIAAIRQYKGPLLQSHGDRDTVVPYQSAEALFNAANQPKRFVRIPNSNHNHRQTRQYYAVMDQFLRELPDVSGAAR